MWQGSWRQRTRAGRGQQQQRTINHWQEHLVIRRISLANFGSTLAGLSLARQGRCPFVPLCRCLAIGRQANNCRWFPPQRPSGMSSPCNGRGRVGGRHDDGNNNGNNNNRRIFPWSVDSARGGRFCDRGGRRRGAVPRNGWLSIASH